MTLATGLCNKGCRDCVYADILGGGGYVCLYILFKLQQRPCPAGEGCTVKRKLRIPRSTRALLLRSFRVEAIEQLQREAEVKALKRAAKQKREGK